MNPRILALMVVFFLFAIFVAQNVEVMEVRFLFWKTGASRALVLVGTFGLGLVVAWLAVWLRNHEGRRPGGLDARPSPVRDKEQKGAGDNLAH